MNESKPFPAFRPSTISNPVASFSTRVLRAESRVGRAAVARRVEPTLSRYANAQITTKRRRVSSTCDAQENGVISIHCHSTSLYSKVERLYQIQYFDSIIELSIC